MLRHAGLTALCAALLSLSGCNWFKSADDAGHAATAAKAARDAKPMVGDIDNSGGRLADDIDNLGTGTDDAERAVTPTGAELLHQLTVKAVAKGLLNIPEPGDAASIQRSTLTDAVKEAGCDYLTQAIETGRQPDASAFYDPLNKKLADYGTPAQNQLAAIQDSFKKLTGVLTGTTDARDAAKSIACAFIPG